MDLTDNVIEEVQKKEGLIASFLDTLPEKALNLGIRIGLALVFFFIGMQLIRLIRKIIRKSMNRAGAETGVIQFVDSFVKASLYIILILTLASSFGVDAASLAECVMGQKAGLGKDMVIFSAPGKTMADIRGGLGISTLVADSAAEVERIQEAAAEQGVVAEIGLRVNPDFTYTADTGVASKFGIDEQLIYDSMEAWKKLPNIRIVGLHAHLKSQELSAETLKGYYRNMFRLSVSMREAFGTLKFVNLGSGMGIPFCETDKPFDTTALGAETQRLMAEFQEKLPETRIYIETGRYAVGTAGTYVAKVVDKKVTHGKNFVLLSATLNGYASPSMVAMLEHFMGNGPIAAWEPIYTGDHSFQMIPLVETAERETVTVTGNL